MTYACSTQMTYGGQVKCAGTNYMPLHKWHAHALRKCHMHENNICRNKWHAHKKGMCTVVQEQMTCSSTVYRIISMPGLSLYEPTLPPRQPARISAALPTFQINYSESFILTLIYRIGNSLSVFVSEKAKKRFAHGKERIAHSRSLVQRKAVKNCQNMVNQERITHVTSTRVPRSRHSFVKSNESDSLPVSLLLRAMRAIHSSFYRVTRANHLRSLFKKSDFEQKSKRANSKPCLYEQLC